MLLQLFGGLRHHSDRVHYFFYTQSLYQGWEIQNTPYNNTWIPGVLPNPGLYSSLYYSSSLCPAPRATGLVHAYQPECVPTSAVDRNCT